MVENPNAGLVTFWKATLLALLAHSIVSQSHSSTNHSFPGLAVSVRPLDDYPLSFACCVNGAFVSEASRIQCGLVLDEPFRNLLSLLFVAVHFLFVVTSTSAGLPLC